MATILFWNINRKPLIEEIKQLCRHHDVDILILAESELLQVSLLETLNSGVERSYLPSLNLSKRLSVFFRYPPESVSPVADTKYVSIYNIQPPIGVAILLVAVHLPSKLYADEHDQTFEAMRVVSSIQEAEQRIGHTRTLVIGDFNMNPFEVGVVGADCLHAVMDQAIALEGNRTVRGQEKSFFYNPMWGRMGDFSPGSSGTYFYRSASSVSYFWNTFDQVLLRPELLEAFSHENLAVISEIAGKSLLKNNRILASTSDHLPIMIELSIERMISNGHTKKSVG